MLIIAACSPQQTQSFLTRSPSDGTLATVLDRGYLICGVNGQLPGFSFQSPSGDYSGLDADYCRAIASALFDDPQKVEFRQVSAAGQFNALTTKQVKHRVDILLRNTAWTLQRDTTSVDFAPVIFYDGQGILASVTAEINTVENLRHQTICVLAGTTAEATLKTLSRKTGMALTLIALDSDNEVFINFVNQNCAIATANRSELMIRRQTFTNPEQYKLSNLTLSQEPLAPVVRSNDSHWLDVIRWIIYGTFRAESLGISQTNIMTLSANANPEIRRLLGSEGAFGTELGIANDFIKRVIHHVGNYAEIYQRNIGDPFQLPRGMNQLWTEGGLLYSMPFR